MNLHEYQAKQLFAEYGIPHAPGRVVRSHAEAEQAVVDLGGEEWVVKAQVHAGGRGKAGGVRRVSGRDAAVAFAAGLLQRCLVTAQTGAEGLPVDAVLLERPVVITRELYLGMLLDRRTRRVMVMASAAGGMDIETISATQPERILTLHVDPVAGLQAYQGRVLGFGLGLETAQVTAFCDLLTRLYRLFIEQDASLVEINPLVVTAAGALLAIDGKLNVDDNALYRQTRIAAWRDVRQEHPAEAQAREHGLNYIALDGDIACMVNGAGLAMATMDLIKLHGGAPANFLDVGGGTTAEKVAAAFKLILADAKVKAVLINIFGGIVRCDLVAEGIIQAVREVQLRLPVVVRLEGTRAAEGRALLRTSGLNIIAAEGLDDAAHKAVNAAQG